MDNLRVLSVRADGQAVGQGCRVHVSGRSTMTLLPDAWQVDIYNVDQLDVSQIVYASKISVLCDNSTICSGKPYDVATRMQDGQTITQILIMDGDDIWRSTTNFAVAGGAQYSTVLDTALTLADTKIDISRPVLDGMRTIRGMSHCGRTLEVVQRIANACNLLCYTYRDILYIIKRNGQIDEILTDEDMVDAPLRINGGCVLSTDMRSFLVGSIVNVSSTFVGTYRVVCQMIDADTQGGAWESKVVLVNQEVVRT